MRIATFRSASSHAFFVDGQCNDAAPYALARGRTLEALSPFFEVIELMIALPGCA